MFLSLQRDLISQDNFAHVGSDEIVSKARNLLQYYHLSSPFAYIHYLFFQPGDNSFGDKAVRRGFIRKVYAILMCQVGGGTWKRSWHYHAFHDFLSRIAKHQGPRSVIGVVLQPLIESNLR